ncbi:MULTISPECIES: hypothetical protein [Pseudomonas]|nr:MULTISPECIES: hypothetical protein [Pseudomonas]
MSNLIKQAIWAIAAVGRNFAAHEIATQIDAQRCAPRFFQKD